MKLEEVFKEGHRGVHCPSSGYISAGGCQGHTGGSGRSGDRRLARRTRVSYSYNNMTMLLRTHDWWEEEEQEPGAERLLPC